MAYNKEIINTGEVISSKWGNKVEEGIYSAHKNIEVVKSQLADNAKKIEQAFQYADNGKKIITSVVGSPLLASDTFQQQHDKIQVLKNTMATNLTNMGQSSSGTEELEGLITKIPQIVTGMKFQEGIIPEPDHVSVRDEETTLLWNLNFAPHIVIIVYNYQYRDNNILDRKDSVSIWCNYFDRLRNVTDRNFSVEIVSVTQNELRYSYDLQGFMPRNINYIVFGE